MKLTIIHPSIGKISGKKYLRAWQMEPLPVAQLAALTPKHIHISFFDDRMEEIDYNHSTDLIAISVETYTAKRAYQIASKFRKKNIPVIMGGFHAKLCTEEVLQHADSVLVGEAEGIWEKILQDFENNQLQPIYTNNQHCTFKDVLPDRKIYQDKNYLKINLLEAGRGCKFLCEFCSIQKFFEGKHNYREISQIVKEINILKKRHKLFFFVDDNIVASKEKAKKLFKEIIPLKIQWVGQVDISIANDLELLELMQQSGCQGVLIGFESLKSENLNTMQKAYIQPKMGIEKSVAIIHKYGLRIYGTFLYGYENDTLQDYKQIINFCLKNKLFMVGFNHLTPFPGTELYKRLEKNGKLLYEKWWLDEKYIYGKIPFKTAISVEEIEKICRESRRKFYGIFSILYRMTNFTNIRGQFMFFAYLLINWMLRNDAAIRMQFPLGKQDEIS